MIFTDYLVNSVTANIILVGRSEVDAIIEEMRAGGATVQYAAIVSILQSIAKLRYQLHCLDRLKFGGLYKLTQIQSVDQLHHQEIIVSPLSEIVKVSDALIDKMGRGELSEAFLAAAGVPC